MQIVSWCMIKDSSNLIILIAHQKLLVQLNEVKNACKNLFTFGHLLEKKFVLKRVKTNWYISMIKMSWFPLIKYEIPQLYNL